MKKSILTKKEDVENSPLPPTTSGHNSVSTHFAFGAGKCGTHKNGLLSPDSGNQSPMWPKSLGSPMGAFILQSYDDEALQGEAIRRTLSFNIPSCK